MPSVDIEKSRGRSTEMFDRSSPDDCKEGDTRGDDKVDIAEETLIAYSRDSSLTSALNKNGFPAFIRSLSTLEQRSLLMIEGGDEED